MASALPTKILRRGLEDPSPKIRAAAIRLSEPLLAASKPGIFENVIRRVDDAAREVRVQLAFSLGEASDPARDAVLSALLRKNADTPFLIPAVSSSVARRRFSDRPRPGWVAHGVRARSLRVALGGDISRTVGQPFLGIKTETLVASPGDAGQD
jgi:hypothetical protein